MNNHLRKDLAASMYVAATPETVFPLLCPVREYDWIEQWQCTMIHTRSGVAEPGCVFQTTFKDNVRVEGEVIDTWVVCRYEPAHEIAFVRNNGHRTILYTIALTPGAEGTRLDWTQQLTGLTAEGNSMVENATQADFNTLVLSLEHLLNHYCSTGTRLSASELQARLADTGTK